MSMWAHPTQSRLIIRDNTCLNLKEMTRSGLPPAQSTTAGAHLRRPHRLRPRRCRRSSWRHREGHLQVVCLSTIKFSVMIIVFSGTRIRNFPTRWEIYWVTNFEKGSQWWDSGPIEMQLLLTIPFATWGSLINKGTVIDIIMTILIQDSKGLQPLQL